MNVTLQRDNKRKEPSHIAYDNMLGAGLVMQRFEDDTEQHFHDQMNKISTWDMPYMILW